MAGEGCTARIYVLGEGGPLGVLSQLQTLLLWHCVSHSMCWLIVKRKLFMKCHKSSWHSCHVHIEQCPPNSFLLKCSFCSLLHIEPSPFDSIPPCKLQDLTLSLALIMQSWHFILPWLYISYEKHLLLNCPSDGEDSKGPAAVAKDRHSVSPAKVTTSLGSQKKLWAHRCSTFFS